MEIKIHRNELYKAVNLANGVAESKTTMPILSNVIIDATDKTIRLTASNSEVWIVCSYQADVISNGRIAINARNLHDIVKEFSSDVIHMETISDSQLDIKCGNSQFKINVLPTDEYPDIPDSKISDTSISVSSAVINEMIAKTSFSMSTDDARITLNGVFIENAITETGNPCIRFVATDSHRLSIVERNVASKWDMKTGMIVPRKGVSELKRLADISDSDITIQFSEKFLLLNKDNIEMAVQLIEGNYPPYERVIPKNCNTSIPIDRKKLVQSLKRMMILTTDRTLSVKFSFSPNNLDMFTNNPKMGEAEENIGITYKSESFDVGFNGKYLLDALAAISDDEVILELGNETTPCIVRSQSDPLFTHVIMPMRLLKSQSV